MRESAKEQEAIRRACELNNAAYELNMATQRRKWTVSDDQEVTEASANHGLTFDAMLLASSDAVRKNDHIFLLFSQHSFNKPEKNIVLKSNADCFAVAESLNNATLSFALN